MKLRNKPLEELVLQRYTLYSVEERGSFTRDQMIVYWMGIYEPLAEPCKMVIAFLA